VLDLLQLFGWPASIILAGVLLDYYSDTELKSIVVQYFRGVRQPKDISVSLHLFLHGFLFRLLGDVSNLRKFFLRSAVISIIVVLIIFIYQQYQIQFSRNNCYITCHAQYISNNYVNGWAIFALLLTNCVVDFCSNIVTVSLIKLGTRGCSRLQFLVIAAASLSLSVIIFTTIFPVGILLSVIVHQITESSTRISLSLTEKEYIPDLLTNQVTSAMNKTGFQMSYFSITPADYFNSAPGIPELISIITKPTSTARDQN
jgi:hypothetical protein